MLLDGEMVKIWLCGVYKSFGLKYVLCGIDFDVCEVEFVVLFGGLGMGKSVLLCYMIGLLEFDEGMVEVDGVDLSIFDVQ